jgi:CcmD family protein
MDSRNIAFMFYGFAIAWLIVTVYVLTLVRRAQRLKRALEQVERLDSSEIR